jgi:hypothetical protein
MRLDVGDHEPSLAVARAGFEVIRDHGYKNIRYGFYRHRGDRSYQWGNFTDVGPDTHAIVALEPSKEVVASQGALARGLLSTLSSDDSVALDLAMQGRHGSAEKSLQELVPSKDRRDAIKSLAAHMKRWLRAR